MENNFSKTLLSRAEVVVTPNQLQLGVRLPWYRSLPLSVVEVAQLTIDGAAVPAARVRLALNDKVFGLSELPTQTGEFWYVLDSAQLTIDAPIDPSRGHEVSLTLNLYPPYIPGLTWVTRATLVLEPTQERRP